MAKGRNTGTPEKSDSSLFSQQLAIAVAAVTLLGFGVAFFNGVFGLSLFQNPTEQYRKQYDQLVAPLVQGSYELNEAASYKARLEAAKDKTPEDRAMIVAEEFDNYLSEKNLKGSIEPSVRLVERIISCQQSLFCRVSDYESFRKDIIQFWYSYRGSILKMRGNGKALDFGSILESEARRMYWEDLAKGDPS